MVSQSFIVLTTVWTNLYLFKECNTRFISECPIFVKYDCQTLKDPFHKSETARGKSNHDLSSIISFAVFTATKLIFFGRCEFFQTPNMSSSIKAIEIAHIPRLFEYERPVPGKEIQSLRTRNSWKMYSLSGHCNAAG